MHWKLTYSQSGYTIPFNSTYVSYAATTETVDFVNVANLSVTITLDKNCCLLIMFSTNAYSNGQIYIRTIVDNVPVTPSSIKLNPMVAAQGFPLLPYHSHLLYTGTYTYNFCTSIINPGTHTAEMQFMVSAGTGYLYNNTLTVVALPIA